MYQKLIDDYTFIPYKEGPFMTSLTFLRGDMESLFKVTQVTKNCDKFIVVCDLNIIYPKSK